MPQPSVQPGLIEPLTLKPLKLPGELAGLRLLHITDLHIRKPNKRLQRLLDELASDSFPGCDLLLFTGDAMHGEGHESAALTYLKRLIDAARPRHGAYGCFGNHDSAAFGQQARDLPITWLTDTACRLRDLPVNLLGLRCSHTNLNGDLVATLLDEAFDPAGESSRFRILLSHLPTWLTPASQAGIDLLFAGHTHGGQCRLPGRRALYNSCEDWPLNLSTGVVQQGRTLAVISRGLGESNWEGLRFFCKPHAPLVTLGSIESNLVEPPVDPPRLPTMIVPW
ncbi:MAG: metallophosphoesterase [Phycisphaerales bacterium]